jgi:hypothetical protein
VLPLVDEQQAQLSPVPAGHPARPDVCCPHVEALTQAVERLADALGKLVEAHECLLQEMADLRRVVQVDGAEQVALLTQIADVLESAP